MMRRGRAQATWYDAEEDVIGIQVRDGRYWKSVEVGPNVIVDVSRRGEILGVEILHAREALREVAPLVLRPPRPRRPRPGS